MFNKVAENEISDYEFVKKFHYDSDGNEDEKTVEIICEFFLETKCSKESFEYLLSTKNVKMLGYCYCYGKGVEQDYKKAIEYYKKAGNANTLIEIGHLYYLGRGVEQDYKKAYEYYKKANNVNSKRALVQIGCCYRFGLGVELDFKKAFEYFEKATEYVTDPNTFLYIGYCYYQGVGVAKDCKKAYEFFKKGREFGYIEFTDDEIGA